MKKKCFKCNKEKDIEEFYRHKEMKDGRLNKCKECAKKDARERYLKEIDKITLYERERSSRPERIAYATEACRAYRRKNPAKYKAQTAVNNAIRDGKIVKPNVCSRCGKKRRIHGHHYDYTKPLAVYWLCPKCHKNVE